GLLLIANYIRTVRLLRLATIFGHLFGLLRIFRSFAQDFGPTAGWAVFFWLSSLLLTLTLITTYHS
ncbi:hypothetical protein C8F04DRAFT_1121323, partial [Mycena alexandri]